MSADSRVHLVGRPESITLPATAFNPRRSKKSVLANPWFNVQSLGGETLFITYAGKLCQGGTSSVLSSSFPMVKVTL